MNKIHDFQKKNEESSNSSVHNFTKQVFYDFFEGGGFKIIKIEIIPPEKSQAQTLGIDYKITLNTVIQNHYQIYYIDLKTRFFNDPAPHNYQHDDILIEYISNDKTGTLGWAEKNLQCDYVLYVFWDIKVAYWLPFPVLKKTWLKNKNFWLKEYGTREAPNKGYKTLNCPVPIRVLYSVMNIDSLCYVERSNDV